MQSIISTHFYLVLKSTYDRCGYVDIYICINLRSCNHVNGLRFTFAQRTPEAKIRRTAQYKL